MNFSRILAAIPFFQSIKGYNLSTFKNDALGGLTVGMIAVPLSMALAINSGVPPQHGLYTTIVAGLLIALCGGSRFNVSGPTAAFVIILQPITNQYGVEGLLLASFMAGIILFLLGVFKIGRMVHFVPHPVTAGFSTGIAIVIALTQIPDLLGTEPAIPITDFISRIRSIGEMFGRISFVDLGIGAFTLLGLIFFPFITRKVPPHLFVLAASALLGLYLESRGFEFRTIRSVFQYTIDGETHWGIPSFLPEFGAPWVRDSGESILSLEMVKNLLPSAFVIAILGAIESLLCAVVADGMKNTRHNPDAELVGQGVGNIVAPFFGGFAATGALARTAASIRAGAKTPIASIVHAIFVLLTLVAFAKYLGYLPMASLGALLLMVAWSMADVRYFKQMTKMAPNQDRLVLFTCLILTVVFDMVVAVAVGMGLACLLFMARMTELTEMEFLSANAEKDAEINKAYDEAELSSGKEGEAAEEAAKPKDSSLILHYEIRGPFFFGAARKAIESLDRLPHINREIEVMIIYLDEVPLIDLTGLIALKSMIDRLHAKGIRVILSGLNNETKAVLGKAGLSPKKQDGLDWVQTRDEAMEFALSICEHCIDPEAEENAQ